MPYTNPADYQAYLRRKRVRYHGDTVFRERVKRRSRAAWLDPVKRRRAQAARKLRQPIVDLRASLRRHGLTESQYQQLLSRAKRLGGCFICGGNNKSGRRLAIDHNHRTKRVRGLLCNRCNNGVERIDNVANWCRKALRYLKVAA